MRCSGTANSRAANIRRSCGDCDAAQTVSSWSPRDHSTTMPRVSIGDATYACCEIVSSTTSAASSNTGASVSAGRPLNPPQRFPAQPSKTSSSFVSAVAKSTTARERVVLDVDEFGGILRDVAVLGDDEGDEVADEAHLVLGERRARTVGDVLADEGEPRLVDAGVEVGRREHGVDAVECERRGGVDADDPCPGERAADEAGVEHARPHDVVDEGAVAGEQPRVLHAGDARPGVAGRAGREIGVCHGPASSSHQGIIFITMPSGSCTNSRYTPTSSTVSR